MDTKWMILLLFVMNYVFKGALVKVVNEESRLYESLFRDHNKEIRPVLTSTQPLVVYLNFVPFNLISMNEKDQSMSLYGVLLINWENPFLAWNASEHGGISRLVVDDSKVWTPKIGVVNSVGRFFDISTTHGNSPSVWDGGYMVWTPGGQYQVSCEMDTTLFPFDEHTCYIIFSSWTMSEDMMTFATFPGTEKLQLNQYSKNGQWDLIGTSLNTSSVRPVSYGPSYPFISFGFTLRRKYLYYMYNIIVPLVLTIILVPLVFLLPSESGEKLSLGITILLTLSVFLLALRETTPATSDYTPMITIFITFQMGITTLSILESVIIMRIHFAKHVKRPPQVLRVLVLGCVGRLLCISSKDKSNRKVEDIQELTKIRENILENGNNDGKRQSGDYLKDKETPTMFKNAGFSSLVKSTESILKHLEIMTHNIENDTENDKISAEWRDIAVVLDWLFFWCDSLAVVLGTFFIYAKPILQVG